MLLIPMKVLSSVDDTVCETCPQGSVPNQVIFIRTIPTQVTITIATFLNPRFNPYDYPFYHFHYHQGKSECQVLINLAFTPSTFV